MQTAPRNNRRRSTPSRVAGLLLVVAVITLSLLSDPGVTCAAGLEVRIVDVVEPASVSGRDAFNATLVFDKAVPNGRGTLTLDLPNGGTAHVTLWPVTQDSEGKRVELGQPTLRLHAQWSPKREKLTAEQLKGKIARLFSAGTDTFREKSPAAAAGFSVKILDVRQVSPVSGRDAVNARLVFDKPLPNGRGTLRVALEDGRQVTVSLWPVSGSALEFGQQDSCTKPVGGADSSVELEAQWAPVKEGLSPQQLVGRDAQAYMADVRTSAALSSPAPCVPAR
jgi:hypothetical protein